MPLNVPYRFNPGEVADADEVNADFDSVEGKFTEGPGGISDGDITTTADINGAQKLSSSPAKQVTEPKLGDNAVSARVLAKDAINPGNDANRAVSGDHIKALTVAQVERFLPAAGIGKNKTLIVIHEVAFNITMSTYFVGGSAAGAEGSGPANPSTPFPQADYDLLAVYGRTFTGTASHVVFSVATGNGGGPNWQGTIVALSRGAGTFVGTLVYVFFKKVAP